MNCRHCASDVDLTLIDLGSAPPSNRYLTRAELDRPETWFPLRVLVCESCWLVQTEDFASARELFEPEYAYFSGFSSTWLQHCERYVEEVVSRFDLGSGDHVVEIGANDGSLLQFVARRGIPCLGIEPTHATATSARDKGIPIVEEFFGAGLARDLVAKGKSADLVVANNVLAHVPDVNDFVSGVSILLDPEGVATFEFPHVLRLLRENQFDTIYHEHFSYFSLTTVVRLFASRGLTVFDVEEHETHGGSLRVFARRHEGSHRATPRVNDILDIEREAGITTAALYRGFQARADQVKNDFLSFLLDAARRGHSVAGYGAAAKGNTLLNYAGVRPDLLAFVVDRNPSKQGKFLPGSRIPIAGEARLRERRPDFVLILPWNLETEVRTQLDYVRTWGGRFVTAIPELRVA
ncbi:MAG: methyltransferase domain-containing protein [Thermoanaerobaculia bacterium]